VPFAALSARETPRSKAPASSKVSLSKAPRNEASASPKVPPSEAPYSEEPARITISLSEVPLSLAPRSEASASSVAPLSETPTPRGAILLSCLVQKGEDIVCLSGTSKVYTAAQVVDDGSETRL